MSFGQLQFRADLTAEGLKKRWALLYVVPVAGLIKRSGVGLLANNLRKGHCPECGTGVLGIWNDRELEGDRLHA